jgi:predicted MFS family arabinose efflux permease/branched-subunit amino acid transport protein
MTATTTTPERNGPLAPLGVAGFRPLAGGYTVNELGNWLGDIALAVLVFDKTGNALATALLFVGARFVPALAAPAIVSQVEALRPRVSLPLLYGADALVFAVLALIAERHFSLALIVGLAAVDGTLALGARALTRATSATLLGPHGLLRRGNALFNLGFTAAGALGPALAGLVVAHAGVSAALWADAASFALVALVLALARALPAGERAEGHWRRRLAEALAYVRDRRLLFGLLIAQALASLFFYAVVPIEVVYAKDTLGAGDSGYGWLLASWGAGMIGGGFLFAAAQQVRVQAVIAAGTLAIGAAYVGLAVAPTLAVACAVSVIGGIGNGVQWISVVHAVQELTSSSMQARVLGLLEAIGAALPVVGFFLGGVITQAASARDAYLAAGAGVLVVLALAFLWLHKAEWPADHEGLVVAPEEPAAAVGHGPAPS